MRSQGLWCSVRRQNISKSERSLSIRNNSRRIYKNILYDHFIKYNHSIENVTITPVEILSKQHGDSKTDKKKKPRRLLTELNWIK